MNSLIKISIVAIIGFLLLIFYSFLRHRNKSLLRLKENSKVAETDKGKVEYACIGKGPIVLSLHGGLGGWDQGLVIADDWLELPKNGFSVLSPSRPGYLRTPLETGKNPEDAADAMAALLDILKIEKVLLLGASGGGSTTLQFALRHPKRVKALVLLSTITKKHIQPGRTSEKWHGRFLFSKFGGLILDIGWWIVIGMVNIFPRSMIKIMFKATTIEGFKMREELDYTMNHVKALRGVKRLMQTQFPLSARKAGLDNDLKTAAELPVYPIENIVCPVLVVHGRLDGNVPFSHGEFTAKSIPNAETHMVGGGGHLLSIGSESDKMRSRIIKFLRDNSEK